MKVGCRRNVILVRFNSNIPGMVAFVKENVDQENSLTGEGRKSIENGPETFVGPSS